MTNERFTVEKLKEMCEKSIASCHENKGCHETLWCINNKDVWFDNGDGYYESISYIDANCFKVVVRSHIPEWPYIHSPKSLDFIDAYNRLHDKQPVEMPKLSWQAAISKETVYAYAHSIAIPGHSYVIKSSGDKFAICGSYIIKREEREDTGSLMEICQDKENEHRMNIHFFESTAFKGEGTFEDGVRSGITYILGRLGQGTWGMFWSLRDYKEFKDKLESLSKALDAGTGIDEAVKTAYSTCVIKYT